MWDVMNYQLPCWITVILMFAFNVETFITTQRDVLYGVLTSLVLFGPASAGFTYCFSFLFQSPSLCQLFVIIFNFFIGLGGPLVQFILRVICDPSNSNSPALVSAANFIEWILRIFPSFNVGNALFKCLNIRSIEALAQKKITVWAPQAILWETIFQGIWCVAYLLLAIQIDKWSTNPRAVLKWKKIVRYLCCRCCFREKKTGAATLKESAAVDDEDVIAENERVDSGEADNDLIILKHLTKVYDTGKVAVDNLSLGIPPGQCFGLLGKLGPRYWSTSMEIKLTIASQSNRH
jgi:ATP-binding cassette subfamily A (ABC1) protein 1